MMYLLFFVFSRQVKLDVTLNKREFRNDIQNALSMRGYDVNISETNKNDLTKMISDYEQKAGYQRATNEKWNDNLYQQSIWLTVLLFLLMTLYSLYGISLQMFDMGIVIRNFLLISMVVIVSHVTLYMLIIKEYKHANMGLIYNNVLRNFLRTNSNFKFNSSDKKTYCDKTTD